MNRQALTGTSRKDSAQDCDSSHVSQKYIMNYILNHYISL